MCQVPLQKNSHADANSTETPHRSEQPEAAPPTPDSRDFGAALAAAEKAESTQTLAPQQVTTDDENLDREKLHHDEEETGAAVDETGDGDVAAHDEYDEEAILESAIALGMDYAPPEPPRPKPPSEREIALAEPPPGKSNTPLSDEEKDRVVVLVSYGHSLRQAAALIGRNHSTLSRHMKKNQDFADKLERFRRYAESDAIREIVTASRKSWRAAAWLLKYLERREGSRTDVLAGKKSEEKVE